MIDFSPLDMPFSPLMMIRRHAAYRCRFITPAPPAIYSAALSLLHCHVDYDFRRHMLLYFRAAVMMAAAFSFASQVTRRHALPYQRYFHCFFFAMIFRAMPLLRAAISLLLLLAILLIADAFVVTDVCCCQLRCFIMLPHYFASVSYAMPIFLMPLFFSLMLIIFAIMR